jgi:DNA-binding NtrC family response regulator
VKPNINRIILLGQALTEAIAPQPSPRGWQYEAVTDVDGLLKSLHASVPQAVALTVERTQVQGMFAMLKRLAPQSLVVLATPIADQPALMAMFPDEAIEYLALPVEWARWQAILNRLARVLDLRRALRETRHRVHREAEERIETERLLAVRQIVDKMSSFVAQVTRDAQGGARYFNELP